MNEVAKTMILLGLIFIVLGVLLSVFSKLPIGRLPGDIVIKRENAVVYIPIGTSVLLSVILSILLSIFAFFGTKR